MVLSNFFSLIFERLDKCPCQPVKYLHDIEVNSVLMVPFVSFSWEDIFCLGDSSSLSEVSLDGNPFAQEQYYKQVLLRHMSQLRQLDMKRITVS
jgi:leucine-rich repeat-containing protein 49